MADKPVILYVEDKDTWSRTAKVVLSSYEIKIAKNQNEGLDYLQSGQKFDLVMVNLNYTEMLDNLGLEILEYIKQEMPDVPRIVVTGRPTKPVNEFFFKKLGVSEFFLKGENTIHDLRRIVGDIISKPKDVTVQETISVAGQEKKLPRASKVASSERQQIQVELGQLSQDSIEIKSKSSQGEARESSQINLDADKLFTLMWELQQAGFTLRNYEMDRGLSDDLGFDLLSENVDLLLEKIGRYLFDHVFLGEVKSAFQSSMNTARLTRDPVGVAFAFDERTVQLAKYPWELLHDGRRHLLSGGMVDLTRYINYPEATTELEVDPPISVLYLGPRPKEIFGKLPKISDEGVIAGNLRALEENGFVRLITSGPTYDSFIEALENNTVHVLHFDGEGAFGLKCSECGSINHPGYQKCQNQGCSSVLGGIPLGYLGFQDNNGNVDWVESKILAEAIYISDIRLAVLSSCQTSQVYGTSMFNATGPALIQAGLPAVVAMQLPITFNAAVQFMNGFYASLSRFDPLTVAVANGRRRISRLREWFVPTLYLRSKDNKGNIFRKGK